MEFYAFQSRMAVSTDLFPISVDQFIEAIIKASKTRIISHIRLGFPVPEQQFNHASQHLLYNIE
jgi:hypothetical protein